MNVKKQIDYWLKTAKSDLETAQIIFDGGKNYHHCLFFCHLILEKGLKALVVKNTKRVAPKIHDLEVLAVKASLSIPDEMKDFFSLMNTFNIEGRYPDEKLEIYKKATRKLTGKLFAQTKETFAWMEELTQQ